MLVHFIIIIFSYFDLRARHFIKIKEKVLNGPLNKCIENFFK